MLVISIIACFLFDLNKSVGEREKQREKEGEITKEKERGGERKRWQKTLLPFFVDLNFNCFFLGPNFVILKLIWSTFR